MPSWNDIPFFEPIGGSHIIMDIAPPQGCMDCGDWSWEMAVVNTGERVDLLTDKPLKTWSAKSECKKCGVVTIWQVYPDRTYPNASDDSFSE